MRKILNWLRKFNTPLYYGVVCLVFGIAFIVFPFVAPVALDVLLILAGVCSVALGVLTVTDLDTTDRGPHYYLNVAKTLLLIGFGIFLIIARSSLADNICLGFGVYILVRAIPTLVKLVSLPSTKDKGWWVRLLLSIVEILLGAWLIFYPLWPHVLAGAMLVILSIDLFVKHYKAKGTGDARGSSTIFDPHFEDKS